MGARNKLNEFHIIGSLGFAGLLGLATGSWAVFAIVAAVLIANSACTGEIRGKGGARPGTRRR